MWLKRRAFLFTCFAARAVALMQCATAPSRHQETRATPREEGSAVFFSSSCTRRSALQVGGLMTTFNGWLRPSLAVDEIEEPRSCNEAIYTILRVQEATQQETRLVKSGKYRDLQRANVKLAVNLMLKNYGLVDAFNAASTLASNSVEASQVGREAAEYLQNILEYFDASMSAKSLNVDTLAGEKLAFVLRALETSSDRMDTFLDYLPDDEVAKAKAAVKSENDRNLAEYKKAFPDDPVYLNPTPTTKA
mmetsp:Transcript_38154/g.122478  ORF Transcript_38154/g.122478 Transcript_38154/m.122478 type:complete len:249 (-) Transcript_38154:237-983(-)